MQIPLLSGTINCRKKEYPDKNCSYFSTKTCWYSLEVPRCEVSLMITLEHPSGQVVSTPNFGPEFESC